VLAAGAVGELPAASAVRLTVLEAFSMVLSVADAVRQVLEHAQSMPIEEVGLSAALGRILAAELTTSHDSPPFDKALMDGFAVQAPALSPQGVETKSGQTLASSATEEVSQTLASSATTDVGQTLVSSATEEVTLRVLETITAGRLPTMSLDRRTASRIMTGAMLPEGCNCVVPVEQSRYDETMQSVVLPSAALKPEAHVMRRGTAATAGSTLLKSGVCLQPQHIAALAEFGHASVPAVRRPRVAILATGDELVNADHPLEPGKIRNSNEPMLVAQVWTARGVPVALGIAPDDEDFLSQLITEGLQHEVLLLTGGVSAGILDLVPKQLLSHGVQKVFHGVHMKPGKPLWFGYRDMSIVGGRHRCLVFGLPGNPVSSLACFELFVRPALRALSGQQPAGPMQARLTRDFTVKGNRPVYQPVKIRLQDGALCAEPVAWSASSDLKATVDANGMALFLPESGGYAAGQTVDIWIWGHSALIEP
jgi:molybdopterin molybdotransferase